MTATQSAFERSVNWRRWAVTLIPGIILYFAPLPVFNPVQRHLLAIFLAAIIALVSQPVPMAVSVVLAVTLLALTKTVPADRVLTGFSNPTVWLIFTAFLFARAITATGIGQRVAYLFIRRFGHNALTLGYSVAASDFVLAPFVPSDTARGGGIIYPIVRSLGSAFGSEPGPTARRLGAFLVLVGFHTTYTASGMFLTGMAANPLIAEFARQIAHVNLTWGWWAAGSSVPGLISLVLLPYLIYRVYPPEVRDTQSARIMAGEELKRLGPMTKRERRLLIIMLCVMAGWVTSPWHGTSNTFVALAGVSAILVTGVLQWSDLLSEGRAWDALIWFGGLLMIADQLNASGVIKIVSNGMIAHMHGWNWGLLLLVLVAGYLYVHYAFASMTAHITALYPAFLAAAVLGGVPPLLAALALAFFSNLNASLTHYSTGSAPVYFGSGYVSLGTWWRAGFLISLVNLTIWLGVGSLWWKVLGLW
ncbi:MAG TPA: DASS family sodium-coupled anion symporter [Bryobacteraceae bacterium]|nr:DASS family sodium-coupled anion symporter [Bryobacteraceae bacterium]